MNLVRSCFLTLHLFLIPLAANGGQDSTIKRQMLSDIDIIKNVFEIRYAPADWKKIYADWELANQIAQAKTCVNYQDPISIKDYQRIIDQVFKSTRDYHVQAHFYSTAYAFLPFRLQGVNDRYFVTWVNSDFATISTIPLKVGDEIVLIDGKSAKEAVEQFKIAEFGNPESETDQGLAELFFTMRLGNYGHHTPKGFVKLSVRHLDSTELKDYSIKWESMNEKIDPQALMIAKPPLKITKTSLFDMKMSTPYYEGVHASLKKLWGHVLDQDDNAELLGGKKSFVPVLGTILWESSSKHFHAYLFETSEHRTFGYIRIATYDGSKAAVQEFADIIKYFANTSEALVVDQVNNPGGYVYYMYALASILSPNALEVPQHRMMITQDDVFEAFDTLATLETITTEEEVIDEIGDNIVGYPVSLDLVNSWAASRAFIINEWSEGRYFTNPSYLDSIQYIEPNKEITYTKPILFLVNNLDFSCADFLPAILQDNKRATIFGSRTAGAGGVVVSESHPNRFGLSSYSITRSIAERADKNPIENLGVIPDILYEITVRDLQENYPDYSKAVIDALENL